MRGRGGGGLGAGISWGLTVGGANLLCSRATAFEASLVRGRGELQVGTVLTSRYKEVSCK